MIATNLLGHGILERLRLHARYRAERLAYRFLREDGGSDTRTFAQLDRRARALGSRVRDRAAFGERALLLYPPGLEFIEAFLGCLAAGVVAVPALPPRRNRNAGRLHAILESARPRLVLGTRQALAALEAGGVARLATDEIECGADEGWEPPAVTPDTVAFLQYTSGSTGTPRGVVVTHGNIAANERALEAAFGHTPDSVVAGWLPPYHDMGLIGQLLQPLYVGFPAVLMSPVAFLREPVRWLRAITEYRATTAGAPNFAYDHCVQGISEELKKGLDLSSWAVAFNGAEPVRAETLDRFARAFAGVGFRPRAFLPCYGLAEATLLVSGGAAGRVPRRVWLRGDSLESHRVEEAVPGTPGARPFVSCGAPGAGTRVLIVHPEARTECRHGEVGEVWVASDSVAGGYWGEGEATRETFHAHLAGTGEGPFLRTGDAGFLLSGELYITGRLKDLIVVRGRNLYPQDVEAAVERALPFARANTVAAVPVEGSGGERLGIVIEADRALVREARSGPGVPALEALLERVRRAVSDDFEVPVWAVALVRPGLFPRTSSGKVQRRACRSLLLAGRDEVVHRWPAGGQEPAPEPAAGVSNRGGLRRLIHDKVVERLRAQGDAVPAVDDHTPLTSLGMTRSARPPSPPRWSEPQGSGSRRRSSTSAARSSSSPAAWRPGGRPPDIRKGPCWNRRGRPRRGGAPRCCGSTPGRPGP
jgi:acyl-CoA synthetase (AMP-forming)/AMP-acid ligase II